MPYATPISPLHSPAKETHSRKAWLSPPTHIEDMEVGPSTVTAPMPGIPRRASASTPTSSGHSTPRRALSPAVSRHPSENGTISAYQAFPASRPMEGLPRRSSSSHQTSTNGTFGVSGLPNTSNGEGGLGLKLYPSPTKSLGMQRGIKDSISSTSTLESSLPSTPGDEPQELPLPTDDKGNDAKANETITPTIPFPAFEPPVLRSVPPPHRVFSQTPTRPSIVTARRNSALGHHRGNGPSGGSLQLPMTTSASTSQLTGSPSLPLSPGGHLRPASMIRKKSGEVVKPSLKVRSMSTPDLTRQGAGADGQSPDAEGRDFPDERSKSVRFAGGDEGDAQALESVVLFLREQKPLAVGRAADPDHAGPVTDTETEADDTDASDFVQFRTRRNAAARAADEAGQIILEGGSRVPRLRTDFSPDARGSLAGEHVILERVELINGPGPLCLRGTMIVRNVAFQKWVSVRFTLDHWQTRSEVSGTHVSHIPASTTGDEGWDRFSFTIKLEDFKRKIEDRQLILCLRFSIGDCEWWDSNNGMNYNFTFKKGPSRRPTRASGPASLGGNFMRINDPSSAPINLRQRGGSPTRELNKAFGVPTSSSKQGGPRNWVFPKLSTQHIVDSPGPESPSPAMPTIAYKVPAPPDVHTHLSLSKWCAPSPPQSPPKEHMSALETPGVPLTPAGLTPEVLKSEMNVMGGQYASLSPPTAAPDHERRSSWSGKSGSWDSFARAMEHFDDASSDTTAGAPSDGGATPIADSKNPAKASGDSSDSSPERRPLAFKRSTGDLRALLDSDDNSGLLTPPTSNLSSPPSPKPSNLPNMPSPMSPSSSITSTGESSPVNTVSTNDSISDFANLDIDVNPMQRGRSPSKEYKMLNNGSYQDFLDKFCFFTSPRMTPNEDPVYSRPTYIPISGSASPNGFPFFASNSSNSPRGTPTPTRQYDSANDAFKFSPAPNGGNLTPKASPSDVYGMPMQAWNGTKVENPSLSLAAQ